MKVDFKDADGNVVLTTAAIASDKNGYDGYVMDLTKEGDSLNDAGEFDAWKYIPEGDVVEAARLRLEAVQEMVRRRRILGRRRV